MEARLKGYRAPNVFNPWGQCCENDASQYSVVRRWSLLQTHFECEARYLLIGEAPGYRGCRYSGIPFTSEAQLMRGEIPGVGAMSRLTKGPTPRGEASATVVWRTLKNLGIDDQTVLWNAFPFHPHVEGVPLSNRAPTNKELIDAQDILAMVVDHFLPAKIIAVGSKASGTLSRLGYTHHLGVRHPSMGGARDFALGMRGVIS